MKIKRVENLRDCDLKTGGKIAEFIFFVNFLVVGMMSFHCNWYNLQIDAV